MKRLLPQLAATLLISWAAPAWAQQSPHLPPEHQAEPVHRQGEQTRDFQRKSVSRTQGKYQRTIAWLRHHYDNLPHKPALAVLILAILGILYTRNRNMGKPRWVLLAGIFWVMLIVALTRLLR